MAGQATPPQRFEKLLDTETNKELIVYPIDAQEIIATGKGRYRHLETCTDQGHPHPAFRGPAAPVTTTQGETKTPAPAPSPTPPDASIPALPQPPVVEPAPPAAETSVTAAPTDADPAVAPTSPSDEVPSIEALQSVLAGIDDGNVVLEMQSRDQRRSAQSIYDARLAELTAPPSA